MSTKASQNRMGCHKYERKYSWYLQRSKETLHKEIQYALMKKIAAKQHIKQIIHKQHFENMTTNFIIVLI